MKYIKFSFFFLLISFLLPLSVYSATVGTNAKPAKLQDFTIVFSNVLSVISILAAFAALAMLIWGGFRYIIAQGDPKAIQAARGTVTWAIAGLVMIVLSWLILLFVSEFTGLPNLTRFCLGVNC